MRPIAVVASAAVSALGRGTAATAAGAPGEPPRSGLRLEPELGLGSTHPLVGHASVEISETDRATALLVAVATDLRTALDARLPGWQTRKLRVLVGTSAGPMNAALAAFAARAKDGALTPELARQTPYFAPLAALEAALGVPAGAEQILGACASATLAIGLGCRALDAGEVELVIAGGYDALSPFVAAGFDALGALTQSAPNPFRAARDGMALGEGAALLALTRADPATPARHHVLGFGASSDAVHLTAPDRDGSGVLDAAARALSDAGLGADSLDLVSAHATSTPYNDAAEARALSRLLPGRKIAVHPFKAQIGHTLGAAGALEALSAFDALEHAMVPASAGSGELDPELAQGSVELSLLNTKRALGVALKLSSAFGGLNAALVLSGKSSAPPRAAPLLRAVYLRAEGALVHRGDPALVFRVATAKPELAERADDLGALVVAAVAELVARLGRPLHPRAAVIVATQCATLEQNERFESRRREGRPVEPRRFPHTSPSACAGLCSLVFGLRGPSFSVGSERGSARSAFSAGYALIAAGDVEEAVLIAAEDSGPVVADVFRAAGLVPPPRGAAALLLSAEPAADPAGRIRPPLDRTGPSPPLLDPATWPGQGSHPG